ncbi:MAG: SurA N-terminal domain-containing protein [Pseudomonadota bacterium]
MLDLMRKHARSWIIKVALGGIIVVFVFWYGWSDRSDRAKDVVATVNDSEITYDYFQTVYESELEKLKLRFGGSIPSELVDKLKLKSTVVKGLVNRELLMQEAQRLGMFVTDEDLVNDIRMNPMFLRGNLFDDRIYKAYLREVKLSPTAYETLRRREMVEQQLIALLTDSVKTDPEELKRFWHFQNDKPVLSMLRIPVDLKAESEPEPQALEAYFKENKAKYEIPASLDVEYIAFSWKALKKKLSMSDDDALRYYKANLDQFTIPEKVRMRHILVKIPDDADGGKVEEIKKKAEEIKARLDKGEDFAQAAAKDSEDKATADKGGDLGYMVRGTLDPELERLTFDSKAGETVGPIRTGLGFQLVRVDEKKAPEEQKFEAVKDKIIDRALSEKAQAKIASEASDFYEKVYRSENLEAPAKEFGFEVRMVKGIGKPMGIPDLPPDPKVLDELMSLKVGDISSLLKVGDDHAVVRVLARTEGRLPELPEVRERVLRDYGKYQAIEAALKKARDVIKELEKQPAEAEAVAARLGIEWKSLDPVSRTTGIVAELGNAPEVKEMLTSISKAAPLFLSPVPLSDGAAVVRLIGVNEASEESYAKEADTFREWILEWRKTEMLTGWLKLLEDRAKISVKDKLL